jgi:hypothetical protein
LVRSTPADYREGMKAAVRPVIVATRGGVVASHRS